MTHTLVEDLDALHNDYVFAVNEAVAVDDLARVERLAADYDRAAAALVARREGTLHTLPGTRTSRSGALRRLTRRGRGHRAA